MSSVTEEQIDAACSAYTSTDGTLREVMRAVVAAAVKACPVLDTVPHWHGSNVQPLDGALAAATATPAIPKVIIYARLGMVVRLSKIQAEDRKTGGLTFYDHEFERCRSVIFEAIDAEIERIDAPALACARAGGVR